MRARITLVSIAAAGALACGCGPGTLTSAGPAPATGPRLPMTGPRRQPRTAVGIARAIAARWASAKTSTPAPRVPVRFRETDYTASVFNAGSPTGFTAFITTLATTTVTAASAATIDTYNGAPARFATPTDHARWQAAGHPSLGQAPATGQRRIVPPGHYSFLPQGSTLTYQQATTLPARAHRLAATIHDHLRPYAGPHPPASLQLQDLAYLLATAPLASATRSAAWQALAALPRLHTCQPQPTPPRGTRTIGLCANSGDSQTIVTVDFTAAVIKAITGRLLHPSPAYPHVSAGTITDSATFTTP